MDINSIIQEVIGKIMADDSLKSKLMADPFGTVKALVGNDLPEDQIKTVAEGVMAKVGMDNAGSAFDKMKNLF